MGLGIVAPSPVTGRPAKKNHPRPLGGTPPPPLWWARTYGGSGDDEANAIVQTRDGGYALAGRTASFDAEGGIWILKLDRNGEVVWEERYGRNAGDVGQSIRETREGGYVVAGTHGRAAGGNDEAWVLKLGPKGEPVWQNTYGAPGNDEAYAVQQTPDGGFLVAGRIDTLGPRGIDAWVFKLDPRGAVVWQEAYGGAAYDEATSIELTPDGGFVMAGRTDSFGPGVPQAWVIKLDSLGKVIWQEAYGIRGGGEANAIALTPDGGFVVAGSTASFDRGSDDVWVLRLDARGEVIWQKTFGGPGFDTADAIRPTSDGGAIVAGWTNSFGAGGLDAWVLRLDPRGEVVWQKTYGGIGDEEATSIQETADAGFILAGITSSFGAGMNDLLVMKLPPNGSLSFAPTSEAVMGETHVRAADQRLTTASTACTVAQTGIAPEPSTASADMTRARVLRLAP